MIRAGDQLIHSTPAFQVHMAETFGHQFAVAFATDIVKRRTDQLTGRVGSPVIFTLFTHMGSCDTFVVIRIEMGTGTDGTPVGSGSSVDRTSSFVRGFDIIQVSLGCAEGDASGIRTEVRTMLGIEVAAFADGIPCGIIHVGVTDSDIGNRFNRGGMRSVGRRIEHIGLSRFFEEEP